MLEFWEGLAVFSGFLTLLALGFTWVVLVKQNRQMTNQLKLMKTQMQAQMHADLIDKERELAKYFIEHPDITKTIYGEGNPLYGKDATESKEIWSTILVADWYENLFVQYEFKAIPEELMPHWEVYIANGWVLSKAYRGKHWHNIKDYYWSKFVKKCEESEEEAQQTNKGKDTESKTP